MMVGFIGVGFYAKGEFLEQFVEFNVVYDQVGKAVGFKLLLE